MLLTAAKNEKIQSLESSQIEVGILDSEQSYAKTLYQAEKKTAPKGTSIKQRLIQRTRLNKP